MEKQSIKKLIEMLQSRVEIGAPGNGIAILFAEPDSNDLRADGFDDEVIRLTLEQGWWREMVTDVVETPDFAEPEESPEQVLDYARDVVSEYIRKRLGT